MTELVLRAKTLADKIQPKAATQAAFFVAGIGLVAIGIAMIYLPIGVITLGVLAIGVGGYIRGGERQ
jgi:hypothetical protein